MAITIEKVRLRNKELLYTSGIDTAVIEQNIINAQTQILAMVAHLYDITQINSDNLPAELELAQIDWAAGQTIIDEYPTDESAQKVGMDYKSNAKFLLKNIVEGKRRFSSLEKAEVTNTRSRAIRAKTSTIDTRASNFISEIRNWD